ncbi:MAG TPA: ABC transporter permease [Chloroflexota bacterium]|jgi:peptide/nickel transport system permease protein
MTRYILEKLLSLVGVLLAISAVVFLMIRLVPGDTVDFIFGQSMSAQRMDEIRALWGFDRPLLSQYLDWLGRLLHGDFGRSILSGRPIGPDLLLRLPVTFELALLAGLWSVAVGLLLGVLAARRPYGKLDALLTTLSLLGLATPSFWLATLLILFLAVHLGWFPAIGFVPFAQNPIENVRSLALPALALGTTMAAAVTRMTRSAMLDVLSQDYIRTARAKGLPAGAVLQRHALQNAVVPVLTIIGTETGKLLGGSLIIEQIFATPGIGQYTANSIFTRDYPVLQAAVLIVAGSYVLVNTCVDIGYAIFDPRLKYS